MLKLSNKISIQGSLRIVSKCAKTGKILQIEEGKNLVLDTGLEDFCKAIVGDITLPSVTAGTKLGAITGNPLAHIVQYAQFGTDPTPSTSTSVSKNDNGTLDPNVVTPGSASDIIPVSYYFPYPNVIVFQLNLSPGIGNGINYPNGITYTEAVLMSLTNTTPMTYRWFARRVFGGIVKTNTSLIEAEWTLTFTTAEL